MFHATEQRLSSFEVFDRMLLPPEVHTLIRVRGSGLRELAEEKLGYDYPFDPRLGKSLVKTASFLLQKHPDVLLCFVSQAEILLLLELDSFRSRRSPMELVADYSASTSARLSLLLGEAVALHAAVYQLPTTELVEDFFAWQQELSRMAALSSHYVQVLRQRGVELSSALQMLEEMHIDELVMVLEENGIDEEQIPTWQRGGTVIYWKDGAAGSSLLVDTNLPSGDGFREFLQPFLT